jgi:hypothetical protein
MSLLRVLCCKSVSPEHVLAMRYQFQMTRVYARPVAASVIEFKTFGHGATIDRFPSDDVRVFGAAFGSWKIRVPIIAFRTNPTPAIVISLYNLGPESTGVVLV